MTEVPARLAILPGSSGMLARRPAALAMVRPLSAERWAELLAGFVEADGDDGEALDRLLDSAAELLDDPPTASFVAICWAAPARVIVGGELEVVSDLPGLARLVAGGSWVERRLRLGDGRSSLRVGEGTPIGRFDAGLVGADGFELVLGGERPDRATPPTETGEPDRAARSSEPDMATEQPTKTDMARPWERLSAAVGGEWMEDSLGLPGRRTAAVHPAQPEVPQEEAATAPTVLPPPTTGRVPGPPPAPDLDPEITLDAATVHQPAPTEHRSPADAAAAGRPPVEVAAAGPTGAEHSPPPAGAALPPPRPDTGHAQATLILPDGSPAAITGTLVIGRAPSLDGARLDGAAAVLVTVDGQHVSRTHLVLRVSPTAVEAIDCASSGHTVLVSAGDPEPLLLEPWVPHELSVGDVLYLGGPTQLRIEP